MARWQQHDVPGRGVVLRAVTQEDPQRPGEETDYEPVTQWELVKDGVDNYLKVFGRPAQVTAWREGKPYVAELAENSAGR